MEQDKQRILMFIIVRTLQKECSDGESKRTRLINCTSDKGIISVPQLIINPFFYEMFLNQKIRKCIVYTALDEIGRKNIRIFKSFATRLKIIIAPLCL